MKKKKGVQRSYAWGRGVANGHMIVGGGVVGWGGWEGGRGARQVRHSGPATLGPSSLPFWARRVRHYGPVQPAILGPFGL